MPGDGKALPRGAHRSLTSPDSVPPAPSRSGKKSRVCQDIPYPQTPSLVSMVQGTPGPPFGKISSSPPCLLPFPSVGHVRAEVEGWQEGPPPGALGLSLWPSPYWLHPCFPSLVSPSLPRAHSSQAEVSPSGMGSPPLHQPHHSSTLLFSSLSSGVGGVEWGGGGGSFSTAFEGGAIPRKLQK